MEKKITVIKGDGIGPEIVTEAQKVLDKIAEKFGHKFVYTDILMGGCSIDKYGVPLTDEAVEVAKSSDAVLLGSIGGNTSKERVTLSCFKSSEIFISIISYNFAQK